MRFQLDAYTMFGKVVLQVKVWREGQHSTLPEEFSTIFSPTEDTATDYLGLLNLAAESFGDTI